MRNIIVAMKLCLSYEFLSISDDLVAICKEYHAKVFKLEGDKWDLERGIKIRLLEVISHNISVWLFYALFSRVSNSNITQKVWQKMIKPPSSISYMYWKSSVLDQLKQICKEYFDRMYMCESQKYDMEFEVRKRGFEV